MVVARSFCRVFMVRVSQVVARALWVVARCLEPRVSAGGQFSGRIISLFTSTHTHTHTKGAAVGGTYQSIFWQRKKQRLREKKKALFQNLQKLK